MSKRTDTIRSLFAQSPAPVLSADNMEAEPRRVAAGAVRSIKDTFSDIERENESLRSRLAEAERVVEIDPDLIDPSPFADRFAHDDDASFETLKQSIAERGQEIPVLLRTSATDPTRYQTAFGHRRIRAARLLGRAVKAIVRSLDDDQLVVAQGLENSAREDLSFIERALFATRLEASGRSRAIVQQALAIDRAEASKLISVARSVPEDLILAIGRAPKIGRGRWQEFAGQLLDDAAVERVRATANTPEFVAADGDQRFMFALNAARRRSSNAAPASGIVTIKDATGAVIAEIRASKRDVKVSVAEAAGSAFAQFLTARLPELFEEFHSLGGEKPPDGH